MRKRTKSREYAIQMMYSAEITESDIEQIISNFWLSFDKEEADVVLFAEKLFKSSYSDRAGNDELIAKFVSKNWSFERIGLIEKCILRAAVDELFKGDAPVYAVMDDYVTLAKKYGDDKTASFVNGILESVRNKFAIERGNEEPKSADKH